MKNFLRAVLCNFVYGFGVDSSQELIRLQLEMLRDGKLDEVYHGFETRNIRSKHVDNCLGIFATTKLQDALGKLWYTVNGQTSTTTMTWILYLAGRRRLSEGSSNWDRKTVLVKRRGCRR